MTLPGMAEAYAASSMAWRHGPERLYERLADVLVDASPVPLAGARVVDLGAGTGVAGRSARRAGATSVVAVDIAPAMLAGADERRVAADVSALPFRADAFDLAVAACCLGHLPVPLHGLREARRVAPAVVASAFRHGWTHPAKAAVDEVAERFGFAPPAWYRTFKAQTEPQVGDPHSLAQLAAAAGYHAVSVRVIDVPAGLDRPEQVAAWRLGMAHLAPFVQSLPDDRRAALRRAAAVAVADAPPLVIPLVVLAASTG